MNLVTDSNNKSQEKRQETGPVNSSNSENNKHSDNIEKGIVPGEQSEPRRAEPGEKKAVSKKGAKTKKNAVQAVPENKPVPAKKANVKKTTEKKEPTGKKAAASRKEPLSSARVTFMLRYHTKYGQQLYITAEHPLFGNGITAEARAMTYLSEEVWIMSMDIAADQIPPEGLCYNYLLKDENGLFVYDWGSDKILDKSIFDSEETLIIDSWDFAGYYENAFYTEPFTHVLLSQKRPQSKPAATKMSTHTFRIKAPLLKKDEVVCLLGNAKETGDWNENAPVLLAKKTGAPFFEVSLDLSKTVFPLVYKYGVYNVKEKRFIRYEDGNNRVLYDAFVKNKKTIVNDGFVVLPSAGWKGAGVSIPVFSLRSELSSGVGEFADIKLLADWASSVDLQLIQILPVNDTTATHTWTDSYPYAAISAFALHPMFLRPSQVCGDTHKELMQEFTEKQKELNQLDKVDYEAVNDLKWSFLRKVYPLLKKEVFESELYKAFYLLNSHWLEPYALFCHFRDKYNTADFNTWQEHNVYDKATLASLLDPASATYDDIAIHFFTQFQLHLQLRDAVEYAHSKGIIIKGDIPIGVYRFGVDAWQQPDQYHMDMQAGAPPDDFAVTGQNWGFPTYNWEKMKEGHFAWWKQRFEQMSYYFDAFRIDHILGFFRIWSIPVNAVEGIMGHFEPCLPVHINEFHEHNIWFDYNRYCRPYISEDILDSTFGDQKEHVKYTFLDYDGFNHYKMKPAYATQRQVETYFTWQEDNEHNSWLKKQLFSLISNVILFEAEGSGGQQFHFRFAMDGTSSFSHLEWNTQQQLKDLYINYFFRRQDDFWKRQALEKLPALKRATNMLVCGEDLGLVPACVPDVMRQLGLLSLEIQRMPKDSTKQFFHPSDAPYLSVVTPSTHDMSTIRGWWEEDRNRTQQFYNNELGQWGNAPHFCDDWINKAIVIQHLYSPAMWSIFQMQDILGINKNMRRSNPHEERINVPAIPKYFWRYRMHITLEKLIESEEFNQEFASYIRESGRAKN